METTSHAPLTSPTPPPPAGGPPQGPSAPALESPEKLLSLAAEPALARIQEDREQASERLRPLLEYLEDHLFDQELNVNELKLACKVRDNSIVTVFHREVGQAPKAYISGLRLETAARLLRDTGLRVWQISDLVGYSAIGVFSKAFHRWSGLRPKYYRVESRRRRAEDQPPIGVFDNGLLERALKGSLEVPEVYQLIHRLCDLYEIDRGEVLLEGR
jgi:AraC-like DNA-binding protein